MNIIQQHLGKLITLGIIGIAAIVMVSSYYGAYNYGADAETTIDAEYTNMENILGQYSLKVAEAAQVPGMYKDDLKEVMTSVMSARQGEGGSKAAFQWFKEHDVNIDSAMYTKIQQIIEGGRNKFANTQTKFIDTKRAYEATLKKDLLLSRGWWLAVANYPKIDLDEYAIISSGHAKEAFKTKVDTGMTLRK
jgi:hypothetical protein